MKKIVRWMGLGWMLLAAATAARADYLSAKAQARTDAFNEPTRDWYLNTLRPAFSLAFRQVLDQCLNTLGPASAEPLGLVLVVDGQGRVASIVWRERHGFADCVDRGLKPVVLPASPIATFHLGVEIGAPQPVAVPLPAGTAARNAKALGAPTVPPGADCQSELVAPGAWPDTRPLRDVRGWVLLGYELRGDGQPQQVRVLQSSGQATLERFATESLEGSRYKPELKRSCQLLVTVNSGD